MTLSKAENRINFLSIALDKHNNCTDANLTAATTAERMNKLAKPYTRFQSQGHVNNGLPLQQH